MGRASGMRKGVLGVCWMWYGRSLVSGMHEFAMLMIWIMGYGTDSHA